MNTGEVPLSLENEGPKGEKNERGEEKGKN